MATASVDAKSAHRPIMPYVAYAVVLALLGGVGVAFWSGQRGSLPGLPSNDRASTPVAVAPPIEPARPASGLKLPPRPAAPAASALVAQKPVQAPAPSPVPIPIASPSPTPAAAPSPSPAPSSPSQASTSDPATATAEKPAPAKTRCTADTGPWPADRTEQGKAIQGLLRDLGLYDGTVYGTVGPTTRAAIRKFQLSAGQPETGEPDETLFASLKKKCAAPAP